MRKTAIAFAILITSSFAVNAQSDTLKPVKGDWGFSVNISGIINNIVVENNKDSLGQYNLFARHYLKNDLALRFGFGVNSNRVNVTIKDPESKLNFFGDIRMDYTGLILYGRYFF